MRRRIWGHLAAPEGASFYCSNGRPSTDQIPGRADCLIHYTTHVHHKATAELKYAVDIDEETGTAALPASPDTCFLCSPTSTLVVAEGQFTRTIAGLGPIVDNYCLIASNQHARSFADLQTNEPSVVAELVQQRATLERHIGPILLTEHGRVPVCRYDNDQHDQHCHYAHALLFLVTVSIEELASGPTAPKSILVRRFDWHFSSWRWPK
jgi:hypothetical protein